MTQEELKKKIKFLHCCVGITIQSISKTSGVDNSHIGKWLKGTYELGEKSFQKLLSAYNRYYKEMEVNFDE